MRRMLHNTQHTHSHQTIRAVCMHAHIPLIQPSGSVRSLTAFTSAFLLISVCSTALSSLPSAHALINSSHAETETEAGAEAETEAGGEADAEAEGEADANARAEARAETEALTHASTSFPVCVLVSVLVGGLVCASV